MTTCLITGGSGTFGTAYVLYAIRNKWHKKIIVYSRDEYKQINMFRFLKDLYPEEAISHEASPYSIEIEGINIRFFIGDVCNYDRLLTATRDVDIVIHAAALKHVPVCEYNPIEATRINITGTANVVNASGINGVSTLVALSTDKAVDPINIYGATKLCLEKVVVGGNNYYPNTNMNVVRYGNIIGSRGSIIHRLLGNIHNGALDLTDPEMTRFWLTIEDAVNLVKDALYCKYRGVVFVPKLKSLRLDELVKALRPDLGINIVGRRPGEKTHEKMITEEDLKLTTYDDSLGCYIINTFTPKTVNKPLVDIKHYTSDSVDTFTIKEFISITNSSIIKTIYGQ